MSKGENDPNCVSASINTVLEAQDGIISGNSPRDQLNRHFQRFPLNLELSAHYTHDLDGSDAVRFKKWLKLVEDAEGIVIADARNTSKKAWRRSSRRQTLIAYGVSSRGRFQRVLLIKMPTHIENRELLAMRLQASLLKAGFQLAVTTDYDLYRPLRPRRGQEWTQIDRELITVGSNPYAIAAAVREGRFNVQPEELAETVLEVTATYPGMSSERAMGWLEAGWKPDEIGEWHQCLLKERLIDVVNPHWAHAWMKEGHTPSVMCQWTGAHSWFHYPSRAKSWIEAGVSPARAAEWVDAGVSWHIYGKRYIDENIEPKQAMMIERLGGADLLDDFSAAELVTLYNAGCSRYDVEDIQVKFQELRRDGSYDAERGGVIRKELLGQGQPAVEDIPF